MVDSRYTGVGYEPPFETPSDKDFMAAHIESLQAERDDWHKIADARSAEIIRLDGKLARLVEAAECALTALNIASRQLTEDMKLVLDGKRWGGMDIDRLKAAIDAADVKP